MIFNISEGIVLVIGLLGFGGSLICLGVGLIISYTKIDMMLSHLKNCVNITERAFFLKNMGPWGRLHLLGMIVGAMVWPTRHIRYEGASAEDIENFPVDIKRNLIILYWICFPFFMVFFGFSILVSFGVIE